MKPLTLFFLSSAIAVGHALVARVEQQLTNLDNEPGHQDHVTGNTTPKSRVLTGVGPKEADNRWFDWDESCSDPNHRTKIVNTFQHSIELAGWTFEHLQELQNGLPNPVGRTVNTGNRKYIFNTDPAFAQMFNGQDHRIDFVKESFNLVTKRAVSPPGTREQKGPGLLRFICNADNHVMNRDNSALYCGVGDGAAHAITGIPYKTDEQTYIEPKYQFETATSITFCPVFFRDDQVDRHVYLCVTRK
ncbi:hypothetical protein F5B22DRAFT_654329 [Xylaria bambusicola]|uniref:uncharacterized protein n=1 Tax=Xylaria bambusicola TaxID=326684 RepID=UPI0020082F8D|nr:uncharacterized protein F5B22DRAFT_654329 [Xylaria bambusicola]KAI0517996.1 hypothetical protein F5B22DRAFT_654329 [Xylaria bambusicola]